MPGERGPFEIVEVPASGAYGAVAVARYHARDGRLVALKVSKLGHLNRPRLIARARDEARVLFKLRHPNIVRVEELLDVGGRAVLVMEWVEGVTVQKLVERLGPPPLPVALEIVRRIALALEAAWSSTSDGRPLRVVHRDIKPANVIVSIAGEVKVVDFGNAKGDFDDREVSTLSTVLGTHGYIAPERLEGVQDSPAIDIYALGVTLVQLATGEALSRSSQDPDAALDGLAERVRGIGGAVGEELAALVTSMCAWDAAERPSAGAVAEVLAGLVDPTDGEAALRAFAAARVVPLHEARKIVPPRDHPEWKELEFLEAPWLVAAQLPRGRDEVPTTVADADSVADRRLRRFLGQPDWAARTKELTWLLANNAGWTELPFLEVLDAVDTPWWHVWRRRATPAEVVASLQMLRYRRTRRVLDKARALAEHPNPAIAAAARELVDS